MVDNDRSQFLHPADRTLSLDAELAALAAKGSTSTRRVGARLERALGLLRTALVAMAHNSGDAVATSCVIDWRFVVRDAVDHLEQAERIRRVIEANRPRAAPVILAPTDPGVSTHAATPLGHEGVISERSAAVLRRTGAKPSRSVRTACRSTTAGRS